LILPYVRSCFPFPLLSFCPTFGTRQDPRYRSLLPSTGTRTSGKCCPPQGSPPLFYRFPHLSLAAQSLFRFLITFSSFSFERFLLPTALFTSFLGGFHPSPDPSNPPLGLPGNLSSFFSSVMLLFFFYLGTHSIKISATTFIFLDSTL